MKRTLLLVCSILIIFKFTIAQSADSTKVYKKRVLESTEIDLLMSLYSQDGSHSPVNGGIGTEKLMDATPVIVISTPLNDDDILTIDVGISAYTSASSSNINPFISVPASLKSAPLISATGASRGGGNTTIINNPTTYKTIGTPWLSSTGASQSDVLTVIHAGYTHNSDTRNFIWGSNLSLSKEYDYTSLGLGGNITGLFNEKNTEVGLKGSVYLDTWKPIYPTELREYMDNGINFQSQGYFRGVPILNQAGATTTDYLPSGFKQWESKGRNSYTMSLFVSQILSEKFQGALFFDLVMQEGMLSTPYQRMYFADKQNYYIGSAVDIANYTTPANQHVYQLADDIERMPSIRYKLPLGVRLNYYLNEMFVLRSYYRYYIDNWGLKANTFDFNLPFRLSQSVAFTPSFRYYIQNQVDYFGPFETHLSSEKYYTSDYDLSKFTSKQVSMAFDYTDIFTSLKIGPLCFKNLNLKFSHYTRSDGLTANIFSFGFKFVGDRSLLKL